MVAHLMAIIPPTIRTGSKQCPDLSILGIGSRVRGFGSNAVDFQSKLSR